MAYKEVIEYHLTYQSRPIVWVRVQGENILHQIIPSAGDGVFVADMLRNEKPMFYDADRKVLSTNAEEVGEEES